MSGTLSLVPGLGQAVNGNPFEGLAWFGSVAGLYLSGNSNLAQVGWDLWMYNMYDAYRDGGASGSGKTTSHSLASNYVANYNPANALDPIGAPVVGFGAWSGSSRGYTGLRSPTKIVTYSFVGLGEEALFRGFLFPAFSNLLFDSAIAGAVTSSAVFAYVHATGGSANLAPGVLAQRFVFGMLFSWQMHRNRYDMRRGVFAHTWYDILVDQEAGEIQGMSIKIPF